MNVDNTEQSILSFCSGYGGIERGLDLAGVKHRVVAHVEIEAFAVANLVAKMEEGKMVPAPVWTNLKTFPLDKFRGRVHGITGGYPCQPFSVAGQRKGEYDPRHLWPYIRRAVDIIRPEWAFFENVEGHLSKGIVQVLADLEGMGYRVEAGIFSAEEVGAPHRRKRVFILAHAESERKRTGLGEIPKKDGEISQRNKNADVEQSSQTKLDDPGRIRPPECQEQTTGVEQSGGELENPKCVGRRGRDRLAFDKRGEKSQSSKDKIKRSGSSQEELADTNKQGSQRWDGGKLQECSFKWPARPGNPQHEWEEPRTVEVYAGPKPTKWEDYQKAIKSLVGGTAYGRSYAMDAIANRVDRLRLCGNGVVPQTASKAWRVLNEKLTL